MIGDKDSLILGIPSKGRILQILLEYFAKADLKLSRLGGERGYRGFIQEIENIEVRFLTALQISLAIHRGQVDIGLTGLDLLYEHQQEQKQGFEIIQHTSIGKARLVLAVPQDWLDVDTIEDVEEVTRQFQKKWQRRMRIATKYPFLTESFLVYHGISHFRLLESTGSTELAPYAGQAEMITDLTSTGETIKANKLKIPQGAVISKTHVVIVKSCKRPRFKTSQNKALEQFCNKMLQVENNIKSQT